MVVHKFKLILVFGILGPPIGLITLFFMSLMMDALQGDFHKWALNDWNAYEFFEGAFVFLAISYFVGIVPAVVSCIAVGWVLGKRLHHEFVSVLAIGFLVGVVYSYSLGMLDDPKRVLYENPLKFTPLILVCFISTLICWRIGRRIAVSAELAIPASSAKGRYDDVKPAEVKELRR